MLLDRITTPGLAHHSYLLCSDGECVVVDPRRDVDGYVNRAHDQEMRIVHVLETHRNEDLVTGSLALADRTGADVLRSGLEAFEYGYGEPLAHGDEVPFGSLRCVALHTPGHTPGHLAYLVYDEQNAPWVLFSGDALFAGGVGRTDLLGEAHTEEMTRQLYSALHEQIMTLKDGVLLCPAHGKGSVCGAVIADRPWTTIGVERARNPSLQHDSEKDFVRAHARILDRPPYFDRMEEMNRRGSPLRPLPSPPPASVTEVDRRREALQIVDVRSTMAFATAHIPQSLSLWLEGVPSYAGWFLDPDRPILLVGAPRDTEQAALQLFRLGFDNVRATLAGGLHAWHASGLDSASVETVTTAELLNEDRLTDSILDVRTDEEAASAPIGTSIHIPLVKLLQRLDELPEADLLTIFCGTGLRSMVAASLLEREGQYNVQVAMGGERGCPSAESASHTERGR